MAQARGETLLVHGAEAVLRFGLTTQVPVRSLFYTSGPSRKLRVGKQEVILRHASLRLLALGSGPAAMAFSALWYMGKRQVTMATLASIQEQLSPAEFCKLRESAQLPGWLSDLFRYFEKAGSNG